MNPSAIPYRSLTEFLDEFADITDNDNRKGITKLIRHARRIWQEIFLSSIFTCKAKYYKVDKTTTPYSVTLGKDTITFIAAFVVTDCNDMEQLTPEEKMNTTPIPSNLSKECEKCGQCDELAACASSFTVKTKEIIIDSVTYTEVTYNRICDNGDVIEVRKTWVKEYSDPDTYTVQPTELEKVVCKLEMKPCGCIVNNESNRQLLVTKCGCGLITTCATTCEPAMPLGTPPNKKFKVENGKVYLRNVTDDYILVHTITNGECPDTELMIPDFAISAMSFGVRWRIAAFNPQEGRLPVRQMRNDYDSEILKLDELLIPITMEGFIAVQEKLHKWGGNDSETFFKPKIISL